MDPVDTDVLIVGAGPSGMLLAAVLHKNGVRFRIVDKDDAPTELTRAPVLWQRTQEILAALGIRDRWLPHAEAMNEESLHFYGRYAGSLSMVAPNSPYLKALYAGQDVTEHALDTHLADSGQPVEYGRELVSYGERGTIATAVVRDRQGGEETIAARWVVSAEGSRSVVRNAVGLDFEGEKYVGYRVHVADVSVRWTLATPPGQTFFYILEHGYMGGQRMPGSPDRFYFYILTPDETPDYDGHDLAIEDVERLVRQMSGDDKATLRDPKWLNTARYRHGLAATYGRGRAFLIGDAARSAPPLYGQGMNYAMQDAWNLGWKLAHVVNGTAPETLLPTYSDERRKLGADLDARIDRTFRFATRTGPVQAALVKAAMPVLLESEAFEHSFNRQFTEVALSYAGIGLGAEASRLGKLTAGDRAPALWVKRLPDCEHANVLDLFDGVRWTLMAIAAAAGDDASAAWALIDGVRAKAREFGPVLRTVLLSQGPRRPDVADMEVLVDAEGRYVSEHDLPASGLLLVRPDGYIGWAGKTASDGLDAYLDRWLLRPEHALRAVSA